MYYASICCRYIPEKSASDSPISSPCPLMSLWWDLLSIHGSTNKKESNNTKGESWENEQTGPTIISSTDFSVFFWMNEKDKINSGMTVG